jgi:hypothetical protein
MLGWNTTWLVNMAGMFVSLFGACTILVLVDETVSYRSYLEVCYLLW